MGFLNTVIEIGKNNKNFKLWEKNQKDNDAQREALHKSNNHSQEELDKAAALGENIINVIDIMDNHSESIAENVETATQLPVAIAPPFAALGSAWAYGKFVMDPNYQKVQKIQGEFFNQENVQKLYSRLSNEEKIDITRKKFFNKETLKNIKNPTLKKELTELHKEYFKKAGKHIKLSSLLSGFGVVGLSIISTFIGATIYSAKLQVDSSKIARFQAREALKDPKAFVNYTPEQIAKAKQELEENPLTKKEKKKAKSTLKQNGLKSIINLFRDRKAYKIAKANDIDESKLVTRELTKDEFEQAQRDKDVIQRTIKIINNEAEKYSESMETAAQVIINGTPYLGLGVGAITSWIFNKIGFFDKKYNRIIDKNCSEQTKKLRDAYIKSTKNKELKGMFGWVYKTKNWAKFAKSAVSDIKTTEKMSKIFGRYITVGMTNKGIRNFAISLIGGLMTGFAGGIIGVKLQKAAARAGRFTAKRELEKDPRNFIGYTEEEYNEVKDVTSNKKEESKFKHYALFLPRVLKQYFAYNKYRKTEFKENQLLQKQLQKQEVSEQQLLEAQNLQRKLFNTFEKVDNNSQQYSESMEAAIEIAQPTVAYASMALLFSPLVIGAIMIVKGKKSPAWAVKKLSGLLRSSSWLMKSKPVKAYLKSINKNIHPTIETIKEPAIKPLGKIFKDTKLFDDPILEVIPKVVKNLNNTRKEIVNLSANEVDALYEQLTKIFAGGGKLSLLLGEKHTALLKHIKFDKISSFIKNYRYATTNEKREILNILNNPAKILEASGYIKRDIIKLLPKINIDKNMASTKLQMLSSLPEDIIVILGKENIDAIQKALNSSLYESDDILKTLLKDNGASLALKNIISNIKTLLSKKTSEPGLVKQQNLITELLTKEFAIPKAWIKQLKTIEKGVTDADYTKILLEKVNSGDLRFNLKEIEGKQVNITIKGLFDVLKKHNSNLALPKEFETILKELSSESITSKKQKELLLSLENLIRNMKIETIADKEFANVNIINTAQEIRMVIPKDLATIFQNIQNGVNNPVELKIALKELGEYIKLFKSKRALPISDKHMTSTNIRELKVGTTKITNRLKKYSLRDIHKLIKKDPKLALETLENKLKNMSADDFAKFSDGFGGIERKDAEKILKNFKKVINNIPSEELNEIKNTLINEFYKDPDRFIALLSNNKLLELVVTPGLQTAITATTISWATLSIVMSYVIQAWLAEMQLKAGRLGVMKSLSELDDPRYYANINPETENI